jgi:hypothetical protein
MRKTIVAMATIPIVLVAGPAWACGGLVAPNGAVRLVRTTTLAAYHEGVEHYVTSFRFGVADGEFGSIVPLPAVPTKVEAGGRWTLQRLQEEFAPPVPLAVDGEALAAAPAEVLIEKQVGALDITVLKGGAAEVVAWASEHGFDLSPDTEEVLSFYATRSPIFMAARYDAARAARRGLTEGDGTAIHLTIPTHNPWVPLHILGLAKPADEVVEADIFLLSDEAPAILPEPRRGEVGDPGLVLVSQEEASDGLLADLRSDRGMDWLPASGMTLTYLSLAEKAGNLTFDLGLDAHGNAPSLTDVGVRPVPEFPTPGDWTPAIALGLIGMLVLAAMAERRAARRVRA